MDITARLCNILAADRNKASVDVVATYWALLEIDRDLAKWASNLSPRFDYRRVALREHGTAFLGSYDVYGNHIAAANLNRYRCIRIETNEQILRYVELAADALQTAGEDVNIHRQRATIVLNKMVEDICYSVHFFLTTEASRDQPAAGGMSDTTMYGATVLIEPLLFAAKKDRLPPLRYQWVIAQIAAVTQHAGIAQVGSLRGSKAGTASSETADPGSLDTFMRVPVSS